MLSDPTRRSLRWGLGIAFGAVFIGSTALYYALDVRFCPEGEGGCIYSRADFAEGSAAAHRVSELLVRIAPLFLAVIAYAIVVLVSPRRFRESRWRYLVGIPVAGLAAVALVLAIVAPFIIWPYRSD